MKVKLLLSSIALLALLAAGAASAFGVQAAPIPEDTTRRLAAPRGQNAPAAEPTISISDASVTEGDGAAASAVFDVTLSDAYTHTVSVHYATSDGTAQAATDYTAASGTITFPVSSTLQTISIPVTGDLLDEADETFTLTLTNPISGTITDGTATGTIIDNDPLPSLSVSGATVSEGNSGTTSAQFAVTLSAPSGRTVTVNYATADGTATTANGDYNAASGTLTFVPGDTTETITVPVVGDTTDEDDETFSVALNSPSNAGITTGQGTATGTITDNDDPPSLSISGATVSEGNSGTTDALFTVTLNAASGKTVTVNYATANSGAVSPGDYTAISPPATLTFNPGQTSRQIMVAVNGDTMDEDAETFSVTLSGASNAAILPGQGTATGTINDDDNPPSIVIAGGSVTEGNSGTASLLFNVTLSAASSKTISVHYATGDGTATVAGGDYTAASGTLTFTPGQTAQSFNVAVHGDALNEANETFSVALDGPTNASLTGEGMATGTISNDDPPPTLSINSTTSVLEGSGSPVSAMFIVTLSAPSGQTVTVNYATADGPGPNAAHAPADYSAASDTLTFSPGQPLTQTISVSVVGDTLDEANSETFTVNLSSAANASIGNGSGTGTINDNDPTPTLSISEASRTEGDAGSSNMTFTVTLSAESGLPITVNYATSDGTAHAPGDYALPSPPPPHTLPFNPGQTSQTISVRVNGDTLDEPNETFTVNLSGATNATILDGTGIGTINDDDTSISINDVTVNEGNSGVSTAVFTVTLSGPINRIVTFDYETNNGTATAGADYEVISGTLTFEAGQTTPLTIPVNVLGGVIDEDTEAFFVDLTNAPSYAPITDGRGVGTILDDDRAGVTVQPSNSLITREDGRSDTFTMTLSSQPTQPVIIALSSLNTAEGVAAPDTITFTSGNWNIPQVATVTGVDDSLEDGNVDYAIEVTVDSDDVKYKGLFVPPVQVVNADNDTAGITASPPSGLVTSENGVVIVEGQVTPTTFVMFLNTQPITDVTIPLSSSNPAEGFLSASSVTFTPQDWNVDHTVIITGVNDNLDDGSVPYTITTGLATSADPNYSGMAGPVVSVTNLDNDAPAIEWVAPVPSNTRWKLGPNEKEVTLEVRAVAGKAAQADIGQVRFYRWDYKNSLHVSIGTVEASPNEGPSIFQYVLDLTTLLENDNQVFAVAYDHDGNPSVEQPSIFIFIPSGAFTQYELFLPSVPRQ